MFFVKVELRFQLCHYNDVIMGVMASIITSLTIVYSTVYSGTDQRKHQSSTSLAFVQGIYRSPGDSLHNWPVLQKMFPFGHVIMVQCHINEIYNDNLAQQVHIQLMGADDLGLVST